MVPNDCFKRVLATGVHPILKPLGFAKRGQNFFLNAHGNWGVVNFQRSTSPTKDRIRFTVNLDIASSRLLRFAGDWAGRRGPRLRRSPPSASACSCC
ncbi:MAG: DUF4304 domain-containing protein [Chloroflexi bacterium]|nr:DUF4304 domain-containing protein [Chloroflexota bacterium]